MKHITLCLALLLSLPACGVTVGEDPAPEPAPTCGWVDNPETFTQSCSAPFAYGSSQHFELQDDGATSCVFYHSICVTPGYLLDECRRTHVTCLPTVNPGRP